MAKKKEKTYHEKAEERQWKDREKYFKEYKNFLKKKKTKKLKKDLELK